MAVEVLFVSPPDVPGSPQPGTGSETDPFQSVQKALDAAKALDGARIKLRAGHYVEDTSLEDFEVDHGAIVVEPADPAAGRVYIDACLPEFLFPQTGQWIRVGPDDDGIDEYVSSRRYEPVGEGTGGSDRGRVRSGALLDEPRHTRLVSYDQRQDLLALNQLWPDKTARPGGPTWPHDVEGNRVWRLHPDQEHFEDRYVPERRNDRPWYHPFVYMGPGVWFDTETSDDSDAPVPSHRRVHIRLSPTANSIDGWPDFDPDSTDPNQAGLALAREETRAVFLKNCHNVRFENLTLRFGSPETVRLTNCTNIAFHHCRIRSGSRAFMLLEEGKPIDKIAIADCEVDGGLPTWFFRSDRKDEYVYGEDITDGAEIDALVEVGGVSKEEVTANQLGFSTSGVLISGQGAIGKVTVGNCEIFNGHDCYLFGNGMRFHHNWLHNLNDDGLAASALGQTNEVDVHSNVMTRCLTGLSFGGGKVGPVHVYANLFDLRLPTLGRRPKTQGDDDVLRQGLFFKNGGDERAINLFHNTFLVLDPGAKGDSDVNDVGFAYYSGVGGSEPRNAYNNIFVAAFTETVNPVAVLAPRAFVCDAGGNLFFRIPKSDVQSFFVRRRKDDPDNGPFATLTEYWNHFWPDQSHDLPDVHEWRSLLKNPWFKSFDTTTGRPRDGDDLRLFKFFFLKSPAKGTAVLMQDPLPDKYVAATGAQPQDRGCYPPDDARLRVGVNGRMVFPPLPQTDPLPADTHADDDWPLARPP